MTLVADTNPVPRRFAAVAPLLERMAPLLRSPLLHNGYALIASAGLTSVLGIAFWGVATRLYSAQEVGIGAALISTMLTLGNISQLNLGNLLNRYLPSAGCHARRLVLLAYAAAALAAALIASGTVVFISFLVEDLRFLREEPVSGAAFVLATVAWTLFALQDSVLAGLRRSAVVPVENAVFSAAKLGLLALFTGSSLVGSGLYAAWILPLPLLLACVNWLIFARFLPRHAGSGQAETLDRRALARFFGWDYLGTLASMAAMGIAPLVVLHVNGAANLAIYYISWEVAYGVYLISRSMGISLLAEAAFDRMKLRRLAIDACIYTLAPLSLVVLVLLVGAPLLLTLLGKDYAETDILLLRLLVLSCLPWSLVTLALAGARVTGRMETVAAAQIATLCIVLGLGAPLAIGYGAVGMASAWLVAHSTVALALLVALWRRRGPSGRTDALLHVLSAAARLRGTVASLFGRREAPLDESLPRLRDGSGSAAPPLQIVREFRRESDVRTALVQDGAKCGERLILKASASAEGRRALVRHMLQSQSLCKNPLLKGLGFKLSQIVASELKPTGVRLVERAWTGEDGRSFLSSRRRYDAGLRCALAGIGEIHARTAVTRVVDDTWLARWLDSGRGAVEQAKPALLDDAERHDALAGFLRAQRVFWLGRKLALGTGHGDFSPGNVLFAAGKSETDATLAAIIDWEAASKDAPPGLDAMFMLLTARALRSGEELGFVVRHMLEHPVLSADERHALAALEPAWLAAYGSMTGRAVIRALCGLAWWQHVTTNLAKASRFSASALWTAINVDRVLALYSSREARSRGPWSALRIWRHGRREDKMAATPPRPDRAVAQARRLDARQGPRIPAASPALASRQMRNGVTEPSAARAKARGIQATGIGVLLAAMLLWSFSPAATDASRMTDLGLVSVLPPFFFLSLALLAAGFAWMVARNPAGKVLPGLYLAALVVVLHATPPLVYGTLRYSWAWKHVGIVDYIQRHGTVDPMAPFLTAYHNWPGLFFATAWIADLFNAGPTAIAAAVQFTPVVLNLALVAVLLWLLRRFTDDRRLLLTATWFFVVGNWIGQDYFSPQGVTFLLYVVLLGLFLGPLGREGRSLLLHRPRFLDRFIAPAPNCASPPAAPRFWHHALLHGLALAIMLVIVVTHQLTPLLVILSAGALVLLGLLAPSYLVFALAAEVAWLFWGAAPFVYLQLQAELASMGKLAEATSKLASAAAVSADRAWVVWVGRSLSATLVLAGLSGGLRRLLRGHWDIVAALLLLAPVPLLAVAYGGESVFRVYLFCLPFLAFFAAALFFPSPGAGRSTFVFPVLAAAFFLSAIGFLFANNGKDREYHFTAGEVAAAEWLYATAPPGSLLVEGARSYPSQFMNYENFTYLPISEEKGQTLKEITTDPERVLARWMSDPRWTQAYVILTRSQKSYLEAAGHLREREFASIERKLLASPRFVLVHMSPDAKIFQLLRAKTEDGSFKLRLDPADGP